MPYFDITPLRNSFSRMLLAALLPVTGLLAQVPAHGGSSNLRPPAIKEGTSPKAQAYYHYSLGHLYEEMAAASGNRSDYVNKAIDNYRLVMKEDPSTSFLVEDIAELYRVSGRIREAVEEAQAALKANPDDLNARRVLARIYTQQIGDAQANRVDENMVRKAVEQYKLVTDKDPKDTESLIMLGRLDKLLENSVDAEAAFNKVLVTDADNEDALLGLAGVYADRGDSKKASELLEKVSRKNPSPRALATLAANYEQMREFGLAADTLKKALALDPAHAELKQSLAKDLTLASRFDEALQTYQELADANPQDSEPYLRMSQIYREQKKFTDAQKFNDKAKAIDPDNLEVRYNDVTLLEGQGKSAEALSTLKQLIDTTAKRNYSAPERGYRAMMLERLGLLYRGAGQYDQAVNAFGQIASLEPDVAPRAEAQMIDTYRLAREFGKGQTEADQALKRYPDDHTLRAVYAELLSDQGKTDAAIEELKKSLNGKNDRETYLALAETYQKAHKDIDSNKALDAADRLSTSKDDKAAVLFLRGSLLERQKKFEAAEKVFRQVLDMDPDNAQAMNYLGYMFADRGTRLPEAQDLVKHALTIDPNNYAFLDSLGWIYFKMNRLDDAEQQLRHSLSLQNSDATIHDHLGDVLLKQGKIKDAINEWQSSLKQWGAGPSPDAEPEEIAKVQKKLDSARVRLAKEGRPSRGN